MNKYLLSRLVVNGLWGKLNFDLSFNKDVTIIIGPNASGKTTLLNLLCYVLTADITQLAGIPFDNLTIYLKAFKGISERTIKVKTTETGFTFSISTHSYRIDLERQSVYDRQSTSEMERKYRRRNQQKWVQEMHESINELVPAVWLPVSRRLPISEDEEEHYFSRPKKRQLMESVDECLRDLVKELTRYRFRLDAQLSGLHKSFEKRVLEIILFSKEHDKVKHLSLEPIPTRGEKDQLLRAFEAAGLLDSQMRDRIQVHFSMAERSIKRMSKLKKSENVKLDDVLIIPLFRRTKSMILAARQLEEERENLFAPLSRYKSIVDSFLNEKTIHIMDNGEIRINTMDEHDGQLRPEYLSSGEKQILILLTQALLFEEQPVVYVADEPELSLHVDWQEKLLKSLIDLGGEIQIIVATHSPDIVGPFTNKVIDLGMINE